MINDLKVKPSINTFLVTWYLCDLELPRYDCGHFEIKIYSLLFLDRDPLFIFVNGFKKNLQLICLFSYANSCQRTQQHFYGAG